MTKRNNDVEGFFDPSRKSPITVWVGMGLIAALFVISQYNYLLFHGLAELFSIAVAWALFMLL